jgi:hypothetical protein
VLDTWLGAVYGPSRSLCFRMCFRWQRWMGDVPIIDVVGASVRAHFLNRYLDEAGYHQYNDDTQQADLPRRPWVPILLHRKAFP